MPTVYRPAIADKIATAIATDDRPAFALAESIAAVMLDTWGLRMDLEARAMLAEEIRTLRGY